MEHNFYKLKKRLQEQGWYVAWAHPCCQTCAWQEVPYEHPDGPNQGKELDSNKLLFNHEQDCNMECAYDEENDEYILPDGITKDDYCTFPTFKPEQTSGSLFCFNGNEQGVKNLIEVLPIIEECGCTWGWNKAGNSRIYIGW